MKIEAKARLRADSFKNQKEVVCVIRGRRFEATIVGYAKKTGYPLLQYIGKGDRASIETTLDQELESLEPSKLFRNVQPTSSGRVWFSKDHGCVVHVERAGVDRVGISIS